MDNRTTTLILTTACITVATVATINYLLSYPTKLQTIQSSNPIQLDWKIKLQQLLNSTSTTPPQPITTLRTPTYIMYLKIAQANAVRFFDDSITQLRY